MGHPRCGGQRRPVLAALDPERGALRSSATRPGRRLGHRLHRAPRGCHGRDSLARTAGSSCSCSAASRWPLRGGGLDVVRSPGCARDPDRAARRGPPGDPPARLVQPADVRARGVRPARDENGRHRDRRVSSGCGRRAVLRRATAEHPARGAEHAVQLGAHAARLAVRRAGRAQAGQRPARHGDAHSTCRVLADRPRGHDARRPFPHGLDRPRLRECRDDRDRPHRVPR